MFELTVDTSQQDPIKLGCHKAIAESADGAGLRKLTGSRFKASEDHEIDAHLQGLLKLPERDRTRFDLSSLGLIKGRAWSGAIHGLIGLGAQFDLDASGALSLTRERIRQIEAKALRKLKHPSRSDKLRSFIDSL